MYAVGIWVLISFSFSSGTTWSHSLSHILELDCCVGSRIDINIINYGSSTRALHDQKTHERSFHSKLFLSRQPRAVAAR